MVTPPCLCLLYFVDAGIYRANELQEIFRVVLTKLRQFSGRLGYQIIKFVLREWSLVIHIIISG